MLFEPARSRAALAGHLTWFAAWAIATTAGLLLTPSVHGHGTHQQLGLPPCPSVLLAGRLCPGCGLTTSISALLHLRLSEAFAANPFGPALYAIWTATAFACLWGFVSLRRFRTETRALGVSLGLFVGAFLLFGIYRFLNTKVAPHAETSVWAPAASAKPSG